MDSDSWLKLLFLILFLSLSAFASAAETAFTSLNRLRLRHLLDSGERKAQAVKALLEHPSTFLSTVLVINSLSIVGAAVLATLLTVKHLSWEWGWAVEVVGMGLVVLIFCEVAPKTIASYKAETIALSLARPLALLALLLKPLVALLGLLIGALSPLFGKGFGVLPLVTEEELRTLVSVSEEEGIIQEGERDMIDGIFDLEETVVHEIMVPRIDIVAVAVDASLKDVVDLALSLGYSRIPVYKENLDNIIGILYAKDLLRFLRNPGSSFEVEHLLHAAHFVPESKRIDELLREFQQSRVHMAIVVDEYGGTAGLVTLEDLLEEIVGEIRDEYDHEESTVERISENEAVIDGRASIDELNELFDVDVDAEEFDTVGGFVYHLLGRIPNVGDEMRVEDLSLCVLMTSGKRVKKVRVVKGIPCPEEQRATGT
ncbi:MAG: HlyC/CorC family transporter [Chloroflexota bacterium]|nr:MAG: HlyC/CorC family transporter [Chloroflexota bacterium]